MVNNEGLKVLEEPFELLDMIDGETKELKVTGYEIGSMEIVTSEVPTGKTIKALRLFVDKITKPIGVPWFDITSKTLIAQLRGYLEQPDFTTKKYKIQKFGVRPKARFTVEVVPG